MTHERAAPARAEGFALSTQRREDAIVLMVSGEIDVATGTQLRTALSHALEDPTANLVVIDLANVIYMASTGIAVLMDARWSAEQRAKSLRIVVGEANAVLRPLRTTGVDRLLAVYPDVGSALVQ